MVRNNLPQTNGGEGGGGGGPPSFQSTLPEAYRAHPTFQPYKSMDDLLKSHIEVNQMVGKNRISIPGNDASPEAWNNFYTQIGRPEAPDKYDFKKPSDFPEGLNIPDTYMKFLADTFHKNGLSVKQAQGIFGELNGYAAKSFKDDSTAHTTAMTNMKAELEQEFGTNAPAKRDAANRALATFVDDKSKKFLEDSGLNDHPQIIRLFSKIGEKLMDPGTEGGGGGQGGGFGGASPAAAQAEINTKFADEEFMKAYTGQFHPGHKMAVAQMEALFKKANPEMNPSE